MAPCVARSSTVIILTMWIEGVLVILGSAPWQTATFHCRGMIKNANVSFCLKTIQHAKTNRHSDSCEPQWYRVRHIRERLRYRTRHAMSNIRNAFGVYPLYSISTTMPDTSCWSYKPHGQHIPGCAALFHCIIAEKHRMVCKLRMMPSSNGNIFRVTGHLCGEFTGYRWIPRTKASDAELWCFLWFAPGYTVE